ncbi:MAG: autotransporter-associated beta strand repeat-containing protein [Kiritimatiellia bacterium]|nr:autotransporter-associated beta strand repeat-containing protein [Kiritimatiellia bacterium]
MFARKMLCLAIVASGFLALADDVRVYTLDVQVDQTDFTAEQVEAIKSGNYTEIKKVGGGKLRVTDVGNKTIGSFTGTLRVSEGIWEIAYRGEKAGDTPLGKAGTAQVIVESGATVRTDVYMHIDHNGYFGGTRIDIAGSGVDGQGALLLGYRSDNVYKAFYLCSWNIRLSADALIARGAQNAYCAGGGTIDLNGHALTVSNGFSFDANGATADRLVSSGTLVFAGGGVNRSNYLRPMPLADGAKVSVELTNDAQLFIYGSNPPDGQTVYDCPLRVQNSTGTVDALVAYAERAEWRGPVSFRNVLRLGAAKNCMLSVSGGISGSGKVVAAGNNDNGVVCLSGLATYDGTAELITGLLLMMNKDSVPGGDVSRLKVANLGERKAICFASKTETRNGWTGEELWALIKMFRYDGVADRNWGIGTYVDEGDEFAIDCNFNDQTPAGGIFNDFSSMPFLTLGGGRAVIRGGYPPDGTQFRGFRSDYSVGERPEIVYSAKDPAENSVTLGVTYFSNVGVEFLNLGRVRLCGSYTQIASPEGAFQYPAHITVGAGTVVDADDLPDTDIRPFYVGGLKKNSSGVLTLLPGGAISNGLWMALTEDSGAGQIASFIMRGGELTSIGRSNTKHCIRFGEARDSLAYMEVCGGTVKCRGDSSFKMGNTANTSARAHFRQKGGDVDLEALMIGYHGVVDMRLVGGRFTVDQTVYSSRSINSAAAPSNGTARISFECGVTPVFSNGLVMCDTACSTGTVAFTGGAMLHTPYVKKAEKTSMWKHYEIHETTTASVSFNGGGISAISAGELLGAGNEAVEATVYSGGAVFDVPSGVSSTISTPLRRPVGGGIASIELPSAPRSGYVAAPSVVIEGDGVGAVAMAEFDSIGEQITGVTVTSPGQGYTRATAYLFCGGPTTNIPLNVTLADNGSVTGDVTKRGEGELVLNAANTFGGAINVEGGTLTIGVDGAIPDGATVVFRGGMLKAGEGVTLPSEFTVDAASLPSGDRYTLVDYNGNPPSAMPVVKGLESLPDRVVMLRRGRLVLCRPYGMAVVIR